MCVKKTILGSLMAAMMCLSLQAKAMIPPATPVIDLTAIQHLITQAELLQQQLQRLEKNPYDWDSTQRLINDLSDVVNKTNGLSYSAANIDQQFKTAFPGYTPPQDYSQQYQQNTQQTLNTLNGVLQSTGLSAQDFADENARMRFLQNQSQNAEGQVQAIQVSNKIAAENVAQLQLLRQTMIAQTNAQTLYYATRLQNEASERAELSQILGAGRRDVSPYGSSGYDLKPFNF